MVNDNPEKYMKEGGLHIERLKPEDAAADGFDPKEVWILFGLKNGDNVNICVVPGAYAIQIADGIKKLVKAKV